MVTASLPFRTLHDGRLLTLADTIEFFNVVLQLKRAAEEKRSLVIYVQAL